MSIYDFTVLDSANKKKPLSDYTGQTILIVNVASQCGFTKQYDGLEKLYQKLKDRNFVVLGFPCNQFGAQEPGTDDQIQNFCKTNFGVTFPVFAKIEVNGPKTHPLYEYLKSKIPGLLGTKIIKWNFTKFLIDSKGLPIKRFAPKTDPSDLEKIILPLLEKS
jgi:glutathione peroxidase